MDGDRGRVGQLWEGRSSKEISRVSVVLLDSTVVRIFLGPAIVGAYGVSV